MTEYQKRHSGSVEKRIEANAEIKFFKLCGIALSQSVTTMRSRVMPGMTLSKYSYDKPYGNSINENLLGIQTANNILMYKGAV